jgi:hypothetical protein
MFIIAPDGVIQIQANCRGSSGCVSHNTLSGKRPLYRPFPGSDFFRVFSSIFMMKYYENDAK